MTSEYILDMLMSRAGELSADEDMMIVVASQAEMSCSAFSYSVGSTLSFNPRHLRTSLHSTLLHSTPHNYALWQILVLPQDLTSQAGFGMQPEYKNSVSSLQKHFPSSTTPIHSNSINLLNQNMK